MGKEDRPLAFDGFVEANPADGGILLEVGGEIAELECHGCAPWRGFGCGPSGGMTGIRLGLFGTGVNKFFNDINIIHIQSTGGP
jgi:hypothetical protein